MGSCLVAWAAVRGRDARGHTSGIYLLLYLGKIHQMVMFTMLKKFGSGLVRNRRATAMLLVLMVPSSSGADKKKHGAERGMLEKMEAVPCGAKERGFTGLGSIFASAGVTAVNSNEKLCPQYLLRTDDVEYHIRPVDGKHPVILPIGKEGEFKIKNDKMYLKVPDGDRKTRAYQVVSMKPVGTESSGFENSAYRPEDRREEHKSADKLAARPIQKSDRSEPPQSH